MTQLTINHDGTVTNMDAMKACIKFMRLNKRDVTSGKHKDTRIIRVNSELRLKVKEIPNTKVSLFSTIFNVSHVDESI